MLVEQPPSGKEFSNDPVFYGPDGNVLTEEESAFLWNATSGPSDQYYDDDDEYVLFIYIQTHVSHHFVMNVIKQLSISFIFTAMIQMLWWKSNLKWT